MISQSDAQWMLTEYDRVRGHGMVNKWIDYHVRVMSILKGKDVSRPSCNCEFGAYARMANSMYEQHLAEIQAAANPVVEESVIKKTRGRSKTRI